MSEKNVAVVQRFLDALVCEDLDAATADFSPTVEIHDHDLPDADIYRGHDGFLKWVAQWGESFETWSVEDIELRAAEADRVVALFRMVATGTGSGVEVDRLDGVAYTLADSSIVRMDYFNDQQQALEAAGLEE